MSFVQVPPDSTGKKVETTDDGTNYRQVINIGQDAASGLAIAPVDGANGLAVDVKTLPPGAATSAKQDTGNTSLASLAAQQLDYDTGGGTATQVILGIALPASGGPVAGGTATNPVRVDPTGTTAQPITDNGGSITVDGTVAATQSGTWNVTNVSGTVSLPTGAATAALQTQPGVDIGDVTVNNASGASAVNIQDGGNSITVDGTVAATQSGTWTVQPGNTANTTAWKVDGSAVTQPVSGTITASNTAGNVANDSADSGNPVKTGGRAVSAEPTPVTAGDRADFITDLTNKQIVAPYTNPENLVSGCISSAMTGTTSTSLVAAPASGLRNYLTQITVSNTHATVSTNMELQDGNGGTTFYIIPAAAVYGGATISFPAPLRQPTTATAIYIKNTTTGASTFASGSGYKGA